MKLNPTGGVRVRAGIKAGAIVCYDYSYGNFTPIVTACSTPDPFPPAPNPNPYPPINNIQWLNCQQCNGSSMGGGRLSDAVCEVCYT